MSPFLPYAPALGWAGESVICAADGRPMRILQPLPASALQGPLREARAELGNLRQSLLRYVRGEANCAPGILLPMLDAVLDNVDELLLACSAARSCADPEGPARGLFLRPNTAVARRPRAR